MQFNPSARKQFFREKRKRERENRIVDQHGRLLRRAVKACKWHTPIDAAVDLSPEKQIELLQDFVDRLDDDIAKFLALYPDPSGIDSCVWLKTERKSALSAIARLMIEIERRPMERAPGV